MRLQEGMLDKNSPVPLYYQLKRIILDDIHSGCLRPGDSLPTEAELSVQFAISRSTVRQAMAELVHEGYLYRQKSKGTYVSLPKLSQKFAMSIQSYQDEMKRLGVEPRTDVLRLQVIPAAEAAAQSLGLSVGEKLVELVRLRYANGDPLVVVNTCLPHDLCAALLEHDFTRESLYEVLGRNEQTRVVRVRRIIEADTATAWDSRYLDIATGFAVQQFRTVGYNVQDRPVEYSVARYRGDRNQFVVESRLGKME